MMSTFSGHYELRIPITAKNGRHFGYTYSTLPNPKTVSKLSINIFMLNAQTLLDLLPYPYPIDRSAILLDSSHLSIPLYKNIIDMLINKGVKLAFISDDLETIPPSYFIHIGYLLYTGKSHISFTSLWQKMKKNLRNVRLIAYNIENFTTFTELSHLSFHFYHGFYFTRPCINPLELSLSQTSVVALLGLCDNGSLEAIEKIFIRSPELSVEFLRLINSPAWGTREKITSLIHALMLIGRSNLKTWLMQMLFDKSEKNHYAPVLLRLALFRARLMNKLLEHRSAREAEEGFFIGMASLFGALFQQKDALILAQLPLSPVIKEAIVEHRGILGHTLALILAYEEGPVERFNALLKEIKLSEEIFGHFVAEAHSYAD